MIRICNKKLCSGCSACASICPRGCIAMIEDNEGFLYPSIDDKTCINCGLCDKICHELHPYEKKEYLDIYAAINNNEFIRLKSSSGGLFSSLAESTISKDGVVFGARFDDSWQVVIDYTESMNGIAAFVGSKYVQARISTAYRDAERFLKDGREVLFTATPCQIAGLKHFLRREYENLTTIDFVCHGTPSPKVWRRYLKENIQKEYSKLNNISFRDKCQEGWDRFHFTVVYENKLVSSYHWDNHYMKAFLSNISLRPSCYQCMAKGGCSHSDLTIGDFWGINNVSSSFNDNKGVGIVIVNTAKGDRLLDSFLDIKKIKVESDFALKDNICYKQSVLPHPNREHFFKWLDKAPSLVTHIEKELYVCNESKVRDFFIKRKYELKLLWSNVMTHKK